MSFGRFVYAINAILLFSLAYLVWFSPAVLFGMMVRHEPSARVIGVMLLSFAILSATALFENSNTRIYVAKIFAVFHGLMLATNAYNFVTSTVPFLALTIHFMFLIGFLFIVFFGTDRFE